MQTNNLSEGSPAVPESQSGTWVGSEPTLLGPPAKQGLYVPQFDLDACGVGFVVVILGRQAQ
jgi:hypothetical protein